LKSEVEVQKKMLEEKKKIEKDLEMRIENLLEEKKDYKKRVKDELIKASNKIEDLTKDNLCLKGSLEVEVGVVKDLKLELEVQKEAMDETNKKEEHLHIRIENLIDEKNDYERIRMKEVESMVKLRRDLENTREEAQQAKMDLEDAKLSLEEVASLKRSMEAQQVVVMESENRAAESEEAIAAWREKMGEMETVMKGLEQRLEEAEEEANYHREEHETLKNMVEPFKDQLESYEMEKKALLSQSEQAHGEVQKLATQYGSLLGQQNHKQKIQHVVKLKQENVSMKKEIATLKEQISKMKRTISKQDEKLNEGVRRFDPSKSFQVGKNKENSMVASTPVAPSKEQTSIRPPRHSIGSPLMTRNKN